MPRVLSQVAMPYQIVDDQNHGHRIRNQPIRSAPILKKTIGISGSFTTSRAQGNDLFIFSTQYAWDYAGGSSAIPATTSDGNEIHVRTRKDPLRSF